MYRTKARSSLSSAVGSISWNVSRGVVFLIAKQIHAFFNGGATFAPSPNSTGLGFGATDGFVLVVFGRLSTFLMSCNKSFYWLRPLFAGRSLAVLGFDS